MKNTLVICALQICWLVTMAQSVDTIKVNVHNHVMTLYSSGVGKPAVILEAGGGSSHRTWQLVQPKIAYSARVVSYDRPGYLSSDTCASPRDALTIAKELKEALTKAEIHPPYIFAGWSYGGSLVRVFAGLYPKDVVGMVLVDPAPEEVYARFEKEFPEVMKEDEKYMQEILSSKTRPGEREEMRLYDSSMNQARRSDKLHSTPTTLLIAAGKAEGGQDRDTSKPMARIWVEELVKWADKRPNLKYEIIANSGHHIAKFQPDTVIKAILHHVDQYHIKVGKKAGIQDKKQEQLKNGNSYGQIKYPVARKVLFDTVIYNKKLRDEYQWMSLPGNEKEMKEYARQQGKLTESTLDSITGTDIITALRKKMNESFSPNDMDVFGVQDKTLYYYKLVDGKNKWHFMKRNGYDGKEELITDTSFIINNKIYTIKKFSFAFKRPLVAMMMAESGEANPHIRFYDLDKKKFLIDSIGPVMFNDSRGVSMAWLPDDKGIIYSQTPPANSSEEKYFRGRLKVHMIGTDQESDKAIFGKGIIDNINILDHETPYVYSFLRSPYIIARIRAGKGDNYAFAVHYTKLDGGKTQWIKLKDYVCNDGTFTAKDEYLYGVVDNVPNKRVVKVNLKTGESPSVFLPEQKKILEGAIVAGKDALFVKYTSPGRSGILKMDYSNPGTVDLSMPFDGTVSGIRILGDNDLVFSITNWIRSPETYFIPHQTNKLKLIPGSGTSSFAEQFTSKVIYVPSRDGLQIPVSLVYSKKITPGEKPQRVLIDAYGCGGMSTDPNLNVDNLTWLGMDGIYAVAHIRGGSELGAEWAKSGSYPTKMNSINDFVDVAEYFVKNNYTAPSMQTMIGASCGTLNVGLAALQRPDLFNAGVYEVGTPDFVTARETSYARGQNIFGPLDTEDGFKARLSLSAYHHVVENKKAPAMLIINGANDYIVKLHNVARYVARLQNKQLSERPILFMVDWEGGHADAGTSRADRIRKWKFLLWQTGHPDFQMKK